MTSTGLPIVTVTPNPAIDVSTSVDRVEPERKLRCDEPRREPGGGGLNIARVITRLGGAALALWSKGGATGELLHELLDRERVLHRPVAIDGFVRESFAVFERSSERHFRFGTPGPRLRAGGLAGLIDAASRLDPCPPIVAGSGSLPPGADDGFYGTLAEAAAARGARVIVDTHGVPLRRALESRRVFLVKPNRRELGRLVARDLRDEADIVRAARSLVDAGGCAVVVVSLGADGAVVVTADSVDRIRAPRVPVQSPIGAGDSTVAGMTLALARGEPLARAARFGVAAGTAAVMTPGSELCRREDVERLFSQLTGPLPRG